MYIKTSTTKSNAHNSDGTTIYGWKLKVYKLIANGPDYAIRFILYFPSGKCWYLDYYNRNLKSQQYY